MAELSATRTRTYWPLAVLLALLLIGFTLRVWNLNFDQGLGTHPDERWTTCSIAPAIGWPAKLEEFADPDRSPLNPMWNRGTQQPTNYTYGHFPLYLGVLTGQVMHLLAPLADRLGLPDGVVERLARGNEACGGIAIAGRFLIATLDTLTILLLYRLGRRAFGVGTGLVAAAFYAFTAQAVQLAHFFAMDPASTTFTVLAVLGGVAMVQDRSLRAAVVTGLGVGLAVASKFSALPVLAVPVTAVVLWLALSPRMDGEQAARSQARAFAALTIAFVVAAVSFFVTSPFAVLDWDRFVTATLVNQGQMVRGVADMPFTRQYRNTAPYLYFIQQQVQWGLGWPLGILALVGTLAAAVALVRTLVRLAAAWLRRRLDVLELSRAEAANVVIWSWVAPYFGITGAFLAKFNRYMSPLLPFVVLFGAGLLWWLWHWGRSRDGAETTGRVSGRAAKIVSGALGAGILACAAFWTIAYVNGVHGHEHTWITASRWIYQHAPRGSVILWEIWDDPLPKTIPGEPGMDMGSTGLTNIDWSPYEEDTAEKYQILKEKLTEADYVVYSSKRIYDSVDELPERYPMTNLYYDAMWDGRLGFELAADVTSPPQLFGFTFQDRYADESWSLYDHPQVTIFHKVRQLSDAEFDALFDQTWESAIPYYRGADSPISPLLELMGLGSRPGSEGRGLIAGLIGLLSGNDVGTPAAPQPHGSDLMFDEPLQNLPVVDNYRWNGFASDRPLLAVIVWWLVVAVLGWAAWPICFGLFAPWLDRGYLFGRTVGWLAAGWLLWLFASAGVLYNTVRNSWLMAGVLIVAGGLMAWRQRRALREFLAARWALLVVEEGIFALAFGFFILIRILNPDIWQPWYGGEKFMEFAFLNGVLRSPTFPPVDPHFAGGYINYYYFGLYLVSYLIKLTGIYAEVAFNLTIPLLFALTVANAFAIAHTAWSLWRRSQVWWRGVGTALLAPFLLALMGNLDGYGQIVRQLSERSPIQMQSVLPGLTWLVEGIAGLFAVAMGQATLPPYDFWGPSRVIPATINEFPYWSFLFADLHPHLIGIPLSTVFVAALFGFLLQYGTLWTSARGRGIAQIALLAFLLGALISVNLWELPTYFGLAVLTLLISEYRYFGRVRIWRVAGLAIVVLLGALLFYLPFFSNYVNVGASGIGLVRGGDDMGLWLLLWGGLGFIIVSWLLWSARNAGLPRQIGPARTLGTLTPGIEPGQDASALRADAEEARPPLIEAMEAAHGEEYQAMQAIDDGTAETGAELLPAADEGDDAAPVNLPVAPVIALQRSGVARLVGISLRHFDRLPRLWYLHGLLVKRPTLSYLLGLAAIPTLVIVAILAWVFGRGVLGLCLMVLAGALPLLWRRDTEADGADHLATMLAITGVAILAGTQVFYLKDFLQGDDWYRMNTLFKFFNQVWVLWALAAAIALPRLWNAAWRRRTRVEVAPANPPLGTEAAPQVIAADATVDSVPVDDVAVEDVTLPETARAEAVSPHAAPSDAAASGWRPLSAGAGISHTWRGWGLLWRLACVLLLAASSVYVIFGTPARVSQRFAGWTPPLGTLNGMAFMQHGSYSWPNDSNTIDLSYDYQAIEWLLSHVHGNMVIAESAEVDYYRAGGTRVASMTGLSGLRGAHVSEQRFGEQVGMRDGLHREFWTTTSEERTEELIQQLQIALIYVGQLERFQHPEGVQKLANMASAGRLDVLYQNDGVVIYSVPGRLQQDQAGNYVPVPLPVPLPLPSMGTQPATPSHLHPQS